MMLDPDLRRSLPSSGYAAIVSGDDFAEHRAIEITKQRSSAIVGIGGCVSGI
jgi:hypothetical protein